MRRSNILVTLTISTITGICMGKTIHAVYDYVSQAKLTTKKEVENKYNDELSDDDMVELQTLCDIESDKQRNVYSNIMMSALVSMVLLSGYNKVCRNNRRLIKIAETQDCMIYDMLNDMYRVCRNDIILKLHL